MNCSLLIRCESKSIIKTSQSIMCLKNTHRASRVGDRGKDIYISNLISIERKRTVTDTILDHKYTCASHRITSLHFCCGPPLHNFVIKVWQTICSSEARVTSNLICHKRHAVHCCIVLAQRIRHLVIILGPAPAYIHVHTYKSTQYSENTFIASMRSVHTYIHTYTHTYIYIYIYTCIDMKVK